MDFRKLAASTRKAREAKQRTSNKEHRLTQRITAVPEIPVPIADLPQASPQA